MEHNWSTLPLGQFWARRPICIGCLVKVFIFSTNGGCFMPVFLLRISDPTWAKEFVFNLEDSSWKKKMPPTRPGEVFIFFPVFSSPETPAKSSRKVTEGWFQSRPFYLLLQQSRPCSLHSLNITAYFLPITDGAELLLCCCHPCHIIHCFDSDLFTAVATVSDANHGDNKNGRHVQFAAVSSIFGLAL